MNITDIRRANREKIEPFVMTAPKAKESQELAKNEESAKPASESWQKGILLEALDMLEENIKYENSHPLDNAINAPIESFDEALIELSFMKTPFFKAQAKDAQANLKPEDVLSLFVSEDEELVFD